MPLYEYQCDACAHRFEVIQKFSDAPIDGVPEVRRPVKKLLSSPAIQFKGSGLYITDYAQAGSRDSKDSKDHAPASSSIEPRRRNRNRKRRPSESRNRRPTVEDRNEDRVRRPKPNVYFRVLRYSRNGPASSGRFNAK